MDNYKLVTKEWSEERFLSSCNEWQKLLDSSGADRFFMSWQWMSQWWINWGGRSSDELYMLAIYIDDELVGIAPLYIHQASYLKGLVPVKRLQLIGSRYTGSSGIRSEYLGTIVKKGLEISVNETISRAIASNKNWDEIVFSDLVKGSYFYDTINDLAANSRLRKRKLGSDDCYTINTEGSLEEYLATLGKNTRLKLYNRRKALSEHGEVSLKYVDLRESDDIFRCINEFHLERYRKPAFSEINIAVLRKVIDSMPESASFKCSSLMTVDKKPVSAIVNAFLNGKIYNIQLGFLEGLDKRISLGTLHLGYAIEMAFESPEIVSFDLLAGEGKRSNYKARLASYHATLESIQILRKPIIRLMYLVNDKMKGNYNH